MRRVELTEEQIKYLRKNYGHKTLEELARHFGVSAPTVKFRAMEIGLKSAKVFPKRDSVWSEEQINLLKELYPTSALIDLSEMIGFSQPTIRKKAIELGLKKEDGYDIRKFNGRYIRDYKHCQRRVGEQ